MHKHNSFVLQKRSLFKQFSVSTASSAVCFSSLGDMDRMKYLNEICLTECLDIYRYCDSIGVFTKQTHKEIGQPAIIFTVR